MAGTVSSLCSTAETVFGPLITSACFNGFDFTLMFEDSILNILPLGLAILWAFLRCLLLWHRPKKVERGVLLYLKLSAYATYAGLQIALLPVWSISPTTQSRLTLANLAISLGTFVLLAVVSYLEHARSLRPSTFLIIYLGVSILLDLARVRTTFLLDQDPTIPGLLLASLLVKAAILSFELVEKRHLVCPAHADASPEATSSIANRSLFIWVNRLLWRGSRKTLTLNDLFSLDTELTAAARPVGLLKEWKQRESPHQDALIVKFLVHYRWSILAGVVPRLCTTGFRFAQPFLVQRVLLFLNGPSDANPANFGYGLVGAYALVYIGLAMSTALYEYYTNRVMAQVRGSLVHMICSKSLRVSSSSTSDAEAITLMSADIDRIALSGHILHESYGSLIELGLSVWLLYRLLGVATAAAAVWLAGALGFGIPLATVAGNSQVPWLDAIERRLALTSKAIGQIIPIKMAGLVDIVSARIISLREAEIKASFRYRLMASFMSAASFLSSSFTPVVGLGAFILLANAHNTGTLNEDVAFAALTLFDLQQQPATYILNSFEDFQIAINSFRRIQEYLLSDEQDDYRLSLAGEDVKNNSTEPVMEKTESSDAPDSDDKKKRCRAVSKTAFSATNASASYATDAQSTIQDLNFEIPHGRTTAVLGPVGCGKSTLLRLILGEMPVMTGHIATSFSHAAYCSQTPWIMKGTIRDNIVGMSNWYPAWYDQVVQACALDSDIAQLPSGDSYNTGTRGSRLSGGQKARLSLARAVYSQCHVVVLDGILNGLDAATEKHITSAVLGPEGLLRKTNTTVVLATNSGHHISVADYVVVLDGNGSISHSGPADAVSTQLYTLLSTDPEDGMQKQDQTRDGTDPAIDENEYIQDASNSRTTSDSKVYLFYMRTVGIRLMLVYLVACAVDIAASVFPSIWVQLWTNSNADDPNNRIGYWLGTYGAFAVLTIVTSVLSEMLFMLVVVPKTSRKFHKNLLVTTFHATASFLTSTDTGTTTNRFSQDLELIDNDLPNAFDMFILELMQTISSMFLIFVGSSYIAATVPLCLVALYFIQSFYLRTSRQLRLLDMEAKAPLISHFIETLHGVSSIRSYNWTEQFLERHIRALEDSQKPYYLMVCIQRWLTLVLDLFVAGLAVLLVGLATSVRGGASNYLGVALLNIVSFSSDLQALVTQWTSLETSIGAVNRIRAYVAETTPEDRDDEPEPILESWPESGAVSIEHLFGSYDAGDDDMILKDVSLDIKPGEKIAICGRTGSGKSSLLCAILNLLHLRSGSVTIDGIPINKVCRTLLRSRLNALSQEGIILEGTVRDGLIADQDISDDRMIDVLSSLHLWKVFEQRQGLDSELNEDTLSHGQLQLFCLARAILRPGKIVIMDESTSSIDSELDVVIDQVVKEKFRGRTVIAVMHKLRSALGFDRVVVVDKGRIIECDEPNALLAREGSTFRALYQSMALDRDLFKNAPVNAVS